MNDVVLSVEGLAKRFGGLSAVAGIDFQVRRGSITAMVGPNGAGKTTTFHMLSGVQKPSQGRITLDGHDITGQPAHRVCAAGVGRTFQLTEIFRGMTVAENVMVGCHTRSKGGFFASGLRLPMVRREERRLRERAQELLKWVGLARYADHAAGSLPFGRQRLVELARAVATEPKLLLLDEPASGLDVAETDALAERVREVRDRGVTVLLIEHDMRFVMSLAEWIVAINQGSRIDEGTPEHIRNSPAVLEAYLGGVQ